MRFFVTFDWGTHSVHIRPCDPIAREVYPTWVVPWIEREAKRLVGQKFGSNELRGLGAALHQRVAYMRVLFGAFYKLPPDEPIEVDVEWNDPPCGPPPQRRWEFR